VAELVLDVMTGHPTVLSATRTVTDAARTMRDQAIGAVIVIGEDRQVCGIVTDRDIVVRAVAEQKDPSEAELGEICSRELTTVEPETSIKDAIGLMRDRALRRLPVVSAGRPVGILSLGDLAIERDSSSVLADISAAPPND
jgi:CBS domain-containing protein